jgi:hypothetical protein
MTSNLANEEIAEHALHLRREAKLITDKRLEGKIGTVCLCVRFLIKACICNKDNFYSSVVHRNFCP